MAAQGEDEIHEEVAAEEMPPAPIKEGLDGLSALLKEFNFSETVAYAIKPMESLRARWGVYGTMHKIYDCVMKNARPITVECLMARYPVFSQFRHMVAATCFISILELQRIGFIRIIVCSGTKDIQDIELTTMVTDYMKAYESNDNLKH